MTTLALEWFHLLNTLSTQERREYYQAETSPDMRRYLVAFRQKGSYFENRHQSLSNHHPDLAVGDRICLHYYHDTPGIVPVMHLYDGAYVQILMVVRDGRGVAYYKVGLANPSHKTDLMAESPYSLKTWLFQHQHFLAASLVKRRLSVPALDRGVTNRKDETNEQHAHLY